MAEASVLAVERLNKSYGGISANRDVSLAVAPGEVHALIGPNGAGKTTLLSMLAGDVRPSSGRILLDGLDITPLASPARTQLGIRRSFQVSSVFPELTVRENLVLACQGIRPGGFRMWRPFWLDRALMAAAERSLLLAGLSDRAGRTPASLSHGERRQLELAMVLVGNPRILLLDEPFAGLSPAETAVMVERLRAVRGQYAVLLIEHDLEAVFSLADRLTVMVLGTPIATDAPAAIRANQAVQDAYLGGGMRKVARC